MKRPIIAIIGRPNVGKSTLFNRLVGRRQAIVEDTPGVTRDRLYAPCTWRGKTFTLVDTGGLIPGAEERLTTLVREQATHAIEEALFIIFLLDGKEGFTPIDKDITQYLRESGKRVFYAINKIDSAKQEKLIYEFYPLGVDKLYPISSGHGRGVDELLDDIYSLLPEEIAEEPEEEFYAKVAIVGRPNVGKSTLLNTILGEERVLVDEKPGTTRDAIDTPVMREGKRYLFIDTAGIRRRGKIEKGIERYSIARAFRAIDRCDITLILLDAHEGVTEQDTKIVGYVQKEGKAAILILNKWDLIKGDEEKIARLTEEFNRRLAFLDYAPSINISAMTGEKVLKVFPVIQDVMGEYTKRITTGELNRAFTEMTHRYHPPAYRSRPVQLYYITQAEIKPPTFVVFTNQPEGIKPNYIRYIENQLRAHFGFKGTPLRFMIRKRVR